jgi:hypothetical protein
MLDEAIDVYMQLSSNGFFSNNFLRNSMDAIFSQLLPFHDIFDSIEDGTDWIYISRKAESTANVCNAFSSHY